MNAVMEKNEFDFVKLRTRQLCMSTTGRRRYAYVNSANKTFERMFGVKNLADKILDSRTYTEINDIMSTIDYDAYFDILKNSGSYRMLAGIIAMKHAYDSGRLSPKYNDRYKRAVERMIDDFDVRTDIKTAVFDEVVDYSKGGRDRRDRRDRDDDYYIGGSRHRRKKRDGYDSIRDLFDDDDFDNYEGLRDSRDSILFGGEFSDDDDLRGEDEFQKYLESLKGNRRSKRDDDDDRMPRTEVTEDKSISDLKDMVANLCQTLAMTSQLQFQNQTRPVQVNMPLQDDYDDDEPDCSSIFDKLDEVTDRVDSISKSVKELTKVTGATFDRVEDQFNDLYSKINTPAPNNGPVKMDNKPNYNKSFVRTSDEVEANIDSTIDNALNN